MHSEWHLIVLVSCFGVGSACYISSSAPYWPWWGLVAMAIGLSLLALMLKVMPRISVQLLLALIFGFAAAALRVESLDGYRLASERYADLDAVIVSAEERAAGKWRLVLRNDPQVRGLPQQLRLIVRTGISGELVAGARVNVAALLQPPNGANTPGGYDFARKAFFDGVGAEGFAVSDVVVVSAPKGSIGAWGARVERMRQAAANTIMDAMPNQRGAVAVAILIGYRHYLDEETADDFRGAGLAHLMAISGLHMGLVAAAVFFVCEYLFASMPAVALRVPPRKLAAVAAFVVACGYLAVSGMGVATVRAFIMVCIGLLAVLLDRKVLSLRSVALAAFIILLITPEAILSVGFQMSFAATAALVVAYEALACTRLLQAHDRGLMYRAGRMVALTAISTLVAEAAVAPFAIYHFQAMPVVGLGANLLVVPLFSLVIMPLALVMLLTMPFGGVGLVAPLLDFAIGAAIEVAHWFGSPAFAVVHTPHQPPAFLLMAAIGLMSVLVLRSRWRIAAGGLSFMAAFMFLGQGGLPGVLIDNEGKVIAAYDEDIGVVQASGGRRGGFRDKDWARFWGVPPTTPFKRLVGRCDTDACVIELPSGDTIARVKALHALRQNCSRASFVILPQRWRRYCRGAGTQISEESVARYGPLGITDDGTLVWSRAQGARPWQISERRRN